MCIKKTNYFLKFSSIALIFFSTIIRTNNRDEFPPTYILFIIFVHKKNEVMTKRVPAYFLERRH